MVIIPIGNLAARRQPHLFMATNIVQGLGKVFMAIGNTDDKWMQGDRHHPAVGLSLLIEDVKLILNGLQEVRPTVPLAYEKGNIVQLDRVGNGEQLTFLHLHRIRLVIVTPVAQVANALLSQKIRGDESLGQGWS